MITTKLFELRDEAERLRLDLLELKKKEQSSYHSTLQLEIDSLAEALKKSQVPDYFKVAVVGQFKTGKSSFVNRLAEERLAGVETNPETAAITLFRYGETPRAVVRLLSAEEWTRMNELYEEAPQHPEAYRVAGLNAFNDDMSKRKNSRGEPIPFEPIAPDKLAGEWITDDGMEHEISGEKWQTKEGKIAFRKEIRRFTSTREPFHYFVKEIVVYAPVPILKDHVELIDTPGLNDTQLYRGQLTEDLLKDVDAILFLTQSGASFSQFDKEFLVRQLRKKRLRHLRLIVTQIDVTFGKAKDDAEENDEDPPTLEEVKSKEESRLRTEISRTLNELLDDNQLSDEEGYYFMEQLDDLRIHFTSAKWHQDGDRERAGIVEVREALFEVLAENYRLTQMVDGLTQSLEHTQQRLRDFFSERRDLIHRDFDPETVRASIAKISSRLKELLDRFGQRMIELSETHTNDQSALNELIDANLSRMSLLTKQVLDDYEKSDRGLHWRSRRAGYWGYLSDLGGKVADKVFPVMETTLNRQLREFRQFHDCVESAMVGLEQEIVGLEKESAIDGLPEINFEQARKKFLTDYLEQLEKQLANEKDSIVQLLDSFATTELKENLAGAKAEVGNIWGTGTTFRQSEAVGDFYDTISSSLQNALETFAKKRLNTYAGLLKSSGAGLFPKLRSSIEASLASRTNAIEERIQLQNEQTRSQLEDYLTTGLHVLQGESVTRPKAEPLDVSNSEPKEVEIMIVENDSGHSYESLFGSYLARAKRIEIDEPYLLKTYQLDNFQRFCEMATRLGTVEEIALTTGSVSDLEQNDESNARLEDLKRLLAQKGVSLSWRRSSGKHNREITTDDGWIILSDRGLDIYKRPETRNDFGLHDLAFRKCKPTKVHIRKSL